MSRDNIECDVRIAHYKTSKGNSANILFFNDSELLLDCKRVKLVRDGSRLYFHRGDSVSGSIKLSGKNAANILQLYLDYDKVKDMEGVYDIKYDKEFDLYYIDKDERIGNCNYKGLGSRLGIKQLNHNPGSREKRGEYVMTATLTENAKKMVVGTKVTEKKTTVSKTAATTVVIKALISLLRIQVEGNDEALSTIDALENYIY